MNIKDELNTEYLNRYVSEEGLSEYLRRIQQCNSTNLKVNNPRTTYELFIDETGKRVAIANLVR